MRIQTTFAVQGFRFVVIVGFCVMLAALFYGFIKGDFFTEGKRLMDMPWGVVTFIDVYVGIMFFTAWVWYREASAFARISWLLLFLCLGNLGSAIYLFKALAEAKGNTQVFTFGYQAVSQ